MSGKATTQGTDGESGEGVDFLAAVEAQNSAAEQEKGDVGAYFGGYFEACWTWERNT